MATPDSEWVEFDAMIELMPWGRNVYTIIRCDQALYDAAVSAQTRRVEGMLDDLPVNVGLNRTNIIPDSFMYAGKALLRRLGTDPGDVVHCRLRPADPDDVPIPDDVHGALAGSGQLIAFQRKTPAQRRRLLQPIEDAVQAQTRQQRIASLVRSLSAGA